MYKKISRNKEILEQFTTTSNAGLAPITTHFGLEYNLALNMAKQTVLGRILGAIIQTYTCAGTLSRLSFMRTNAYTTVLDNVAQNMYRDLPQNDAAYRRITVTNLSKSFFNKYKKEIEHNAQEKALCKVDALKTFATENGLKEVFEIYANETNLLVISEYRAFAKIKKEQLKEDIIMFLIECAWAKNTPYYISDQRVEELINEFLKLIEKTKQEEINVNEVADIFIEFLKKYPELTIDEEKQLEEAFTIDFAEEIANLTDKVNNYRYHIKDYADRMAVAYEQMQNTLIELDAYKMREKTSYGKEIYRILEKYAPITEYEVRNKVLYYTVKNAIKVSSAEAWKKRLKNYNIGAELQELLYYACATDAVNLYTSFRFQLSKDRGINRDYYENTASEETLNHPHLYYFQCYGNNTRILLDCMREKDYQAMIEQTIEIVGNLNYLDAPVVNKLIWDIRDRGDTKCFSFEGRNFSYREFLAKGEIYEAIRECMEKANNTYN